MYARTNLTGDGVVDSSCHPNYINSYKNKIIPSNLGMYSACCPLPENNGHLYNVSSEYIPMVDVQADTEWLNRLGLTQMPDYKLRENPYNKFGNGVGYYYPSDGRVQDPRRNIKMVLDKPAEVGSVDMDLVSTFDNSNYGGIYKSYEDIKNGQIAYYVDQSQSQPFEYPIYTLSSMVDKVIRKDPMDSVKPEYIKTPITSTLHEISNDQSTRDALFFREDIMSRQQNLYNRTNWSNRWIKPPTSYYNYKALGQKK